jgi:hypothetical protein
MNSSDSRWCSEEFDRFSVDAITCWENISWIFRMICKVLDCCCSFSKNEDYLSTTYTYKKRRSFLMLLMLSCPRISHIELSSGILPTIAQRFDTLCVNLLLSEIIWTYFLISWWALFSLFLVKSSWHFFWFETSHQYRTIYCVRLCRK